MALKLPINQKRLTNVAIVRMKSHGIRFEIACYKNKVLNWREGIEKDINEVLQTDTVFTHVSKAIIAKENDLQKAFGTTDLEEICRKILKNGDLQVSDKEREVHMDGLFRDIVQIIVERCVHPQTSRQHTALTVENALKTIGFSVQPDHKAKPQALKAIESLESRMPESFARAKMRLRMTFPSRLVEEIRANLRDSMSATIETEETVHSSASSTNANVAVAESLDPESEGLEKSQPAPEEAIQSPTRPALRPGEPFSAVTFVCDPSKYRDLDRLATVVHAGQGVTLQVLTAAVLCENTSAGGERNSNGGYAGNIAERQPLAPEGTKPRTAAPAPATAKKGFKCSACAQDFEDSADYRQHCRSDRHNFNLKRKVKGLPPVSDDEFAEIGLDLREGFLGGD